MASETKALVKRIRAAGHTVSLTAGQHFVAVHRESGERVYFGSTPHRGKRAMQNAKAALKRAGMLS